MTEKMCFSISKCQDIRCAHIALFQCAISRFQSSIDSKIFINPKRERIILIDFYIGTRFSRKRSYISIQCDSLCPPTYAICRIPPAQGPLNLPHR